MLSKQDVSVIRKLAAQVADIAALPIQEKKKAMWRKLNSRNPDRPMVCIDQVCWNEMNVNNELTLQCSDEECRQYEGHLRRILFQWKHFPVDMVVEPFINVQKAVVNSGFGIDVKEETAVTDPTNAVLGHMFTNQFETMDDLEKIKTPVVSHDNAETDRRMKVAHELFDGILDVRLTGISPYVSIWDPVSTWMGVENVLYALIDKPELLHGIASRMLDGYLKMLDQLESQALLCGPQSLIHCTGAFTDDLPAAGYDPAKPRTKDIWMFGLAQMFTTVSPPMFQEFEIEYTKHICKRFGLVYYGCCEPLDIRMDQVRLLPNVRKVSMSPWVNQDRGASQIRSDYVYSRKPNPALLAEDSFNPEKIREDLTQTRQACEKYGCPLEFIQKDISTVRYQPERLFKWAEVAMQVAGG